MATQAETSDPFIFVVNQYNIGPVFYSDVTITGDEDWNHFSVKKLYMKSNPEVEDHMVYFDLCYNQTSAIRNGLEDSPTKPFTFRKMSFPSMIEYTDVFEGDYIFGGGIPCMVSSLEEDDPKAYWEMEIELSYVDPELSSDYLQKRAAKTAKLFTDPDSPVLGALIQYIQNIAVENLQNNNNNVPYDPVVDLHNPQE